MAQDGEQRYAVPNLLRSICACSLDESLERIGSFSGIFWARSDQSLSDGDGEHLIGRDAGVAIPLNSPTVSRHHAKIVIASGVATLEDPASKNGTYLRGEAVRSAAKLSDGDRIRIGAFELTYRSLTSDGSTETQN